MAAPRHTEQAPHMIEDITLSFSDEEWLGLDAWQRDLYRTVMRDTMELFTSLGYMFLKREELELRDRQPALESAGESPVIEEIAGEHVMTQMTETPYILENVRTAQSAATPGTHPSAGNLFTPQHPAASSGPKTLFPQSAETPETQGSLEHYFMCESAPTSTGQESAGEGSMTWDTETAFIHQSRERGSLTAASAEFTTRRNTGDEIRYPRAGAATSCEARADLVTEEQTLAADIFPDTDYLTIIQVEEINVALGREVKTIHREGLDVHPEYSIPGNIKDDLWDLQGEAAFPLALMGPPNPTNYQYPWPETQRILAPGTPPWSEQIHLDTCLHVEEGARAAPAGCQISGNEEFSETNTRESLLGGSSLYKCSICCKSFLHRLHLEHHERLHMEERTFTCPTCDRHFINYKYLQEHQQSHRGDSLTGKAERAAETSQEARNFRCTQCNRRFSQLVGLHRHQKIHTRNKILPRSLGAPPRKVYKLPAFHPAEGSKTDTRLDPPGEACSKLHRHLQLSTAFLQNLITSTCGFQYD